jgi:hypothetical protein
MSASTIDARTRRLGVRKRWERFRQSDRLKDLLDEFLLWTAVWTGFPITADELEWGHPSGSTPPRSRERQDLRDQLTASRDAAGPSQAEHPVTRTGNASPESPPCGYPA